jgi:hypothetical protein
MELNFFAWIREGVRQAVLHGVSDAVDHLGPSTHDEEMSGRVLQAIQQHQALPAAPGTATIANRGNQRTANSRKLGRSLDQIVNKQEDAGSSNKRS